MITKFNINTVATAEKILQGEMPDPSNTNDRLLVIGDDVVNIYIQLLSRLLLTGIDDSAQDIVDGRIELFDDIIVSLNIYRCGRLYKLVTALNETMAKYETNLALWPSAKFRRNVLSFATDFWILNDLERTNFLVLVPVFDSEEVEEALQPAKEEPEAVSTDTTTEPIKKSTVTKKTSKK